MNRRILHSAQRTAHVHTDPFLGATSTKIAYRRSCEADDVDVFWERRNAYCSVSFRILTLLPTHAMHPLFLFHVIRTNMCRACLWARLDRLKDLSLSAFESYGRSRTVSRCPYRYITVRYRSVK